ncbi:MAG TPA: hypothetical protein PLV25_08180, partial [Opitutales bacterium]|nr:hypothetical protein [Opitutales bacterium]
CMAMIDECPDCALAIIKAICGLKMAPATAASGIDYTATFRAIADNAQVDDLGRVKALGLCLMGTASAGLQASVLEEFFSHNPRLLYSFLYEWQADEQADTLGKVPAHWKQAQAIVAQLRALVPAIEQQMKIDIGNDLDRLSNLSKTRAQRSPAMESFKSYARVLAHNAFQNFVDPSAAALLAWLYNACDALRLQQPDNPVITVAYAYLLGQIEAALYGRIMDIHNQRRDPAITMLGGDEFNAHQFELKQTNLVERLGEFLTQAPGVFFTLTRQLNSNDDPAQVVLGYLKLQACAVETAMTEVLLGYCAVIVNLDHDLAQRAWAMTALRDKVNLVFYNTVDC